jgi:hypothetical protein
MDRSFFGVSCVDVNDEPDPRLRLAMCNQIEQCAFDSDSQVCRPQRPMRTNRTNRTAQSAKALKKSLKSNPGQARAVLNALEDYADQDDTEPMIAKLIKWSLLIPLAGHFALRNLDGEQLGEKLLKVLSYLRTIYGDKWFMNLWDSWIRPALKAAPALPYKLGDALKYVQTVGVTTPPNLPLNYMWGMPQQ